MTRRRKSIEEIHAENNQRLAEAIEDLHQNHNRNVELAKSSRGRAPERSTGHNSFGFFKATFRVDDDD